MNDFRREMATTAIVVCNENGIANAVEEDVFEQYEEAELLTSMGGKNWFVPSDSGAEVSNHRNLLCMLMT